MKSKVNFESHTFLQIYFFHLFSLFLNIRVLSLSPFGFQIHVKTVFQNHIIHSQIKMLIKLALYSTSLIPVKWKISVVQIITHTIIHLID